MAAPKLAVHVISVTERLLPAGLPATWAVGYVAAWAGTAIGWLVTAATGPMLVELARRLLGARLSPASNPPPELHQVFVLAGHNLPLAAWPLLLGVTGAHRHAFARRFGDVLVLAAVAANTMIVGIALACYGSPLVAFIVQLPVEWAALALGAASWLRQRQRPLTPREGLTWLALVTSLVLCAAVIETYATPHKTSLPKRAHSQIPLAATQADARESGLNLSAQYST